jgi:hypothetical protein
LCCPFSRRSRLGPPGDGDIARAPGWGAPSLAHLFAVVGVLGNSLLSPTLFIDDSMHDRSLNSRRPER